MAQDRILKKANDLLSSADAKVDYNQAGQNVLLSNLRAYVEKSKSIHPEGFGNLLVVEDKDPCLTVSKIYSKGLAARDYVDFGGIPAIRGIINPYFKLYKLVRSAEGEITKILRIPLLGEEMKSSTLNPLSGFDDDYKSVGLMQIQWDLKDQTAFGSERLVEVQIQLKFSNPSVIGHSFPTQDVLKDSKEPDQTFQYVDLIRRSNGRNPNPVAGDQYETYSLRLDIGYVPPGGSAIDGLSSSSKNLSRDFIENVIGSATEVNNISLLLELQDYDLNILENGEMELTLSYFSWMERQSETADYDIFGNFNTLTSNEAAFLAKNSSPLGEKRAELIRQKASLKSKLEAAQRDLKEFEAKVLAQKERSSDESTQDNRTRTQKMMSAQGQINQTLRLKRPIKKAEFELQGVETSLEEVEKDLKAVREKIISANKIERYARVMTSVLESDKIYSISVERNELLMYSKEYLKYLKQAFEEAGKPEDAKKAALFLAQQRSLKASKKVNKNKSKTTAEELKQSIAAQANILLKSGTDREREDLLKIAAAQGLDKRLSETAQTAKNSDDKYQIHFVFLGDLIDAVTKLGGLSNKMREDKFGLMLGSFSYIDLFSPVNNLPAFSDVKIPTSVNFADIPISVHFFSQYFARTVIDKGITKLQLLDFINGLVNQLAVPALNVAVGGIPSQHTVSAKSTRLQSRRELSFGYLSKFFQGSTNEVLNKAFAAVQGSQGRINLAIPETVEYFSNALSPSYATNVKGSALSKDTWNYFLIHGAQNKVLSGLGEGEDFIEQDYQKGVYHFRFGGSNSDRSDSPVKGRTDITRTIQFEKVKKSGQREMMVDRYMNQEGNDLNLEIWNIFNVTMTLDGNSLFAPGKIFYIRPAVGFMGSDGRNITKELGLGGYYLVTDVSNRYDIGGDWETTVKGAWQSGTRGDVGSNIVRSPGQTITMSELVDIIPDNPYQSTEQSIARKEDLNP